ncbi:hypothetical protein ACIFOC_01104 [Leucobacter aridicollis]|uniref:hypothetical protein n=1 Tax=Leucobacter aridicollis TaxID=283878 RepID=UPI0037C76690
MSYKWPLGAGSVLLLSAMLLMRSDEAFLNGLGTALALGAIVIQLRYVFAYLAGRRSRTAPQR